MLMYIVAIMMINFFTFFVAKTCQRGMFVIKETNLRKHDRKLFLIGDFMSQPEQTYEKIEMPYGQKINLRYSMMGFDPKNAGEQLRDLLCADDYVIAPSIGCKAIIYSHRDDVKRIFISPVTHGISLKSLYQIEYQYSVLLVILSYLLGWLSVIPIIPAGNEHYSLALCADQLYCMYYNDPTFDDVGKMDNTIIVLAKNDKHLENCVVKSIYGEAVIQKVNTDGNVGKYHTIYDAFFKSILAK